MMNQSKTFILPFLLAGLSLALIGCGGGESEDSGAPVAKKRPAAPPKPVEKTVEQLTANLNIDGRIVLDEQDSPRPENQRIAILSFFHAMLAADSGTLKSMLAFDDQLELKAMMDTGFAEQMDEVSLLMLKTGDCYFWLCHLMSPLALPIPNSGPRGPACCGTQFGSVELTILVVGNGISIPAASKASFTLRVISNFSVK